MHSIPFFLDMVGMVEELALILLICFYVLHSLLTVFGSAVVFGSSSFMSISHHCLFPWVHMYITDDLQH